MRQVIIVTGKTRHGKSEHVKTRLAPLYNRVIIFDYMQEYHDAMHFENLSDLIDYCKGNPQFIVSFSDMNQFSMLCDTVYHLGNCLFIIEEVSRVFPAKSAIPEEFRNLLWIGGHREVSLLFVSQRAASIDISMRSQYTRCYSFKQTEPADVKWLHELSGKDDDVYQVIELPPYEYIDISDDGVIRRDKSGLEKTNFIDESLDL